MLDKDLYLKMMNKLNIAFNKKQDYEYCEFIYEKLSELNISDIEVSPLFDKLCELDKYPRLGKIKQVYREKILRITKKGSQSEWYIFICSCGESIVLDYRQLLSDPTTVVSCPGAKLNRCNRHFSGQKLIDLVTGKPIGSEIIIPIDDKNETPNNN